MQYYKPDGDYFVGDCMPFYHEGTFHLYYLLDEGHHGALEGLGGHQWAHASSRDLVTWQHHPLALPLTDDHEASICTGSVVYRDGVYYAFYATRLKDWREYISLATSRDGVCFEKRQQDLALERSQGYSPAHFRDPFVFYHRETEQYHMLVTAQRLGERLLERGGCLAHFVSRNLRRWRAQEEPLLSPGYLDRPECPDYFYWNGWYYLLFSIDSHTHYRMSRRPFGPWQRPEVDTLDGLMLHVMRSAPFRDRRRLAAGYLAPRHPPGERGKLPYAGSVVFRELVQHEDGALGTRFPPEMVPGAGETLALPFTALSDGVRRGGDGAIEVEAWDGFAAGALCGVPHNAHIRLRLDPEPGSNYYGLCLRGSGAYEDGFELRLSPYEQTVEVRRPQDATYVRGEYHTLHGVADLDRPLTLEVVLLDDVIDVCVDERRCLVGRFPRLEGERLFFFSQMGAVVFREVVVREIG